MSECGVCAAALSSPQRGEGDRPKPEGRRRAEGPPGKARQTVRAEPRHHAASGGAPSTFPRLKAGVGHFPTERGEERALPTIVTMKREKKWYRLPGSNGGPLDPQSSALTY